MKKFLCFILASFFPLVGACKLYDTFTVATIEGVPVTYMITKEGEVTIGSRVGTYKFPTGLAVNISTVGAITIPSEVEYNGENYTVIGIGQKAFFQCEKITSIELPNSVTEIEMSAFGGCKGLTEINIGNNISRIWSNAFSGCKNLKSITIPESVIKIGDTAFGSCDSLQNVYISNLTAFCQIEFGSATSNPLYAAKNLYLNGTLVTELKIPEGVTEIKPYLFHTCQSFSSIIIPNSVAQIGEWAFYNCPNVTKVALGNGLRIIGERAFQKCEKLTDIVIPNNVQHINEGAFAYCDELTYAYLENANIGKHAFYECSKLKKAIIGNGVVSIGEGAFYKCVALDSLIIPNDIYDIKKETFYGCSGLQFAVIGNKVRAIEEKAFTNCIALKKVINLSNLKFTKGSEDYGWVTMYANDIINAPNGTIEGSYIFSKTDKGNTLVKYTGSETRLVLPKDYYGESYFIGTEAFQYPENNSLQSVVIPDGIIGIGSSAFMSCSGLTTLYIGKSIKDIASYSFNACKNLSTVYVRMQEATNILAYAFKGIAENAILYVPYGKLDLYKNNKNWSSYFNQILESPPMVGDNFTTIMETDSSSIEYDLCIVNEEPLSVEIKAVHVVKNPEHAELHLPEKITYDGTSFHVTAIGESAFRECVSLEGIVIPRSVKSIAKAFQNCQSLKRIIVQHHNPSDILVTSDAFQEIADSTKLYVPGGAYERYVSHNSWKCFNQIIEYSPIWIGGFKSQPSFTSYLPIFLKDKEEIAGIQFRLTLPDGISVNIDNETSEHITKEGALIIGNKELGTKNSYLFIALSLDGHLLKGGNDAIIQLKVCVEDMPLGDYEALLSDIYVSTPLLETLQIDPSISDVKIINTLPGDCNNDGRLSVVDVSMIINEIVKKENTGFNPEAADINKDGRISIVDATMVTNLILDK